MVQITSSNHQCFACSSAPLTKMNHAIIITTYTHTMHTEPKPTFYDPLVNSKNHENCPKMNSEMKENEKKF